MGFIGRLWDVWLECYDVPALACVLGLVSPERQRVGRTDARRFCLASQIFLRLHSVIRRFGVVPPGRRFGRLLISGGHGNDERSFLSYLDRNYEAARRRMTCPHTPASLYRGRTEPWSESSDESARTVGGKVPPPLLCSVIERPLSGVSFYARAL